MSNVNLNQMEGSQLFNIIDISPRSVFSFSLLQAAVQTYAFLVFAGVCVLGAVYLYTMLPETKNKTFVEISRTFAKINKVPVQSPDDARELELQGELSLAIQPGQESTNGKVMEMESSF